MYQKSMYVTIVPDYRVRYDRLLRSFQPTTEICGYIALTGDRKRLAWGKTHGEAIVNGFQMIRKIQLSQDPMIRAIYNEQHAHKTVKLPVVCTCSQDHDHIEDRDKAFDAAITAIFNGEFGGEAEDTHFA